MDIQLPGVAFVAGAESAIGRATVLAFAQAGVRGTFIAARRLADAEQIAAQSRAAATHPHYRAVARAVDPTAESSIADAVQAAVAEFGRIDHAANAIAELGSPEARKLGEYEAADFFGTLDGNLCVLFAYLKAEVNAMMAQEPVEFLPGRGGVRGSIVSLCSASGTVSLGGHASFSASQHAIAGMIKTAGVDYAKDGLRVNGVAPHIVERGDGKFFQTANSINPEPETPDDVADVIAFLSSPRASYVTGQVWNVGAGGTIL